VKNSSTATVATTIPAYLAAAIDLLSRDTGLSRAEILRRCVDAGFDRVAEEAHQQATAGSAPSHQPAPPQR
jgi:hypothetical protein